MPIVGIGLNESMKFACNPSNPPCGAQRALHVGRRRVGGPSNLKPRPQLENLALRHQLRVLRSSVKRPKLTSADRLFWAWLCAVLGGFVDRSSVLQALGASTPSLRSDLR